jgi:hypothetical protein
MIPGAASRRRSVLVFKTEPAPPQDPERGSALPPRLDAQAPSDPQPEQDDAVRRLSAPMKPRGRRELGDPGDPAFPRLYPGPEVNSSESDVAALIAKVSM